MANILTPITNFPPTTVHKTPLTVERFKSIKVKLATFALACHLRICHRKFAI